MSTDTEQLTLIKCTGQECENFKGLPFQDKYTIEDVVLYKEKDTGKIRLMDLTLKCNKCWGEHTLRYDTKNPKSKYVCPVCRDSKSKYNNMNLLGHKVHSNQEILGFCNNNNYPYFKVRCLRCNEIFFKSSWSLLEDKREHNCKVEVLYKDWIGKEIANQKILGFFKNESQTYFKVQCLKCNRIYNKSIFDLLTKQNEHKCNPEVLYKDLIGKEIANQKVLGFYNGEYKTMFRVRCLKCKEVYPKNVFDLLERQSEHKCNPEVLYKDWIGKEIANQRILGFCNNGHQIYFKVQCLICNTVFIKSIRNLLTKQHPHECIKINTNYFDESYLEKVFGLQKIIDISKDKSKQAKWTLKCIECGKIKVEIAKEVACNINQGKMPSCDCTTTSVGSLYTERALQELGYSPIKEMYFGDLRDINPLRYDFAININEQLILIEYDGVQHITGWGYNKESLEYIQSHDKMKDDYAKEHGYPLIRISHLVQLEDIKDYLKDEIDAILEELNSEADKDSIPK